MAPNTRTDWDAAIERASVPTDRVGSGWWDQEPPEGRGAPAAAHSEPRLTTFADVTPERVSWLWPGYLPAGKLVLVDGDPSCGKSTMTTDLAARCSTGSPWPDGAASAGPADVLLLSAEDGLGDTIAPRLHAAGADVARVHALTEVPQVGDDGGVRMVPPSLPRDVPILHQLISRHRIKLVIVDVLMAYLNGKVDSHRDQDVRGVLHQLTTLAEATGCTMVLIRHLNKAGGGSPLYRGGGSIGIIGAARAAFIVGRDPDDQDRRILACSKSNLAVEPASLAYRLVSDNTLGCARVEWEGGVDLAAGDLLRGPRDDEERSERDEAVDWLTEYLAGNGGEAPAKDVLRAGRADGIAERTLQRARARAGVTSQRRGFGQGSVWVLDPSFPPQSRHSRQGSEAGMNGANVAGMDGPSAACSVCELPLDPVVAADRHTTHPTCGAAS